MGLMTTEWMLGWRSRANRTDRPRTRSLLTVCAALCATWACDSEGDPTPPPPPPDPSGLQVATAVRFSGLEAPVLLTHAGDGRIFIVEQAGRVRVVSADGQLRQEPYLDISDQVRFQNERGLLGLAFHPRFSENGYLYVSYTDQGTVSRVVRYTQATASAADPTSASTLLSQDQPFGNHNGGHLAFGPDGMLYLGLGDGGSGGDPQGHGQNLGTLLGAMLRIDVDNPSEGRNYGIPSDNPFLDQAEARDEIWAYGLRNPWRFSFDAVEDRLYIGDVGQSAREEISAVAAGGGGYNFGWNRKEGDRCFASTPCDDPALTDPVLVYDNPGDGCSVTGGHVYRGSAMAELRGTYLYSDFCAGWLRGFRLVGGTATEQATWIAEPIGGVMSLGVDVAGEIYILTSDGDVHQLVRAP